MNPFKKGDTVTLLSGGELMTVEEVTGDDVRCVWFEKRKLKERKFHYDLLVADDGMPPLGDTA